MTVRLWLPRDVEIDGDRFECCAVADGVTCEYAIIRDGLLYCDCFDVGLEWCNDAGFLRCEGCLVADRGVAG